MKVKLEMDEPFSLCTRGFVQVTLDVHEHAAVGCAACYMVRDGWLHNLVTDGDTTSSELGYVRWERSKTYPVSIVGTFWQ